MGEGCIPNRRVTLGSRQCHRGFLDGDRLIEGKVHARGDNGQRGVGGWSGKEQVGVSERWNGTAKH